MEDQFMLTPFFLDETQPGLEPLVRPDWQVNAPELAAGDKQQRMTALYRHLADFVSRVAAQGNRPVSVAGDCCTTIGVMAGLQQAGLRPTLLWFDAHGDFNTWETTPSGFLGGMPLAMIAGLGEQTMPLGVGLRPVPAENIILTDGRDLDPGERDLVVLSGVKHVPDVAQMLHYPLPDGPLYVHFDTDVVDPAEMGAMNYPAPGGPLAEMVRRVFQRLAATGRVTAVSLSAWNPVLDINGQARDLSLDLLAALLS